MPSSNPIIWTPSQTDLTDSNLAHFISFINTQHSLTLSSYTDLYWWSLDARDLFWQAVWNFCGMVGGGDLDPTFQPGTKNPMWGDWFPNVELNYAENLLNFCGTEPAIISWDERGRRDVLSWDTLRCNVASIAQHFRNFGCTSLDTIAAFAPNLSETICCMLAATSLGAAWSSCAQDFGPDATGERFSQLSPKILVVADGYFHKGTAIHTLEKIALLIKLLPSVERVLLIPYLSENPDLSPFSSINRPIKIDLYREVLRPHPEPLFFNRVPFKAPLFVMFSSGTTGNPKCIVHSVGGTLLEHRKELSLHTNVKPREKIFYQTTTSWMMWNFLVSNLACGATIVIYDGAPLFANGLILWQMAAQENFEIFGTNAKYLATLEKDRISPTKHYQFPALNRILSTGSPLAPQSFDFVERDIKSGIQISSISGGTDILGCFALGSPIAPVRRGELQVRSLGLRVEIFNEHGDSVLDKVGELVCTNPFPSMPIGFLNDPDNARFYSAYFERFPGVWHHGDYAELTAEGGLKILGRSDATLNPGGVRIGTADIYNQINLFSEIADSLAVSFVHEDDAKIVLFVRLIEGSSLTDELEATIRKTLRTNLSPFHVPWKIFATPDFPQTRNGKVMELVVRDALIGPVSSSTMQSAVNPEVLEYFYAIGAQLRT